MHNINITDKCNQNCLMCTIFPSRLVDKPLNEIIKDINILKNTKDITLTGGEPTLRKDIFKILNYINIKYPLKNIFVLSNGIIFNNNLYAEKISKIKNLKVIINIYGDKVIHDKITKVKGSFDYLTNGINNLLLNDVKIIILITKLLIFLIPYLEKVIDYYKDNYNLYI